MTTPLGSVADTAVTNPGANATVVALLKGLLAASTPNGLTDSQLRATPLPTYATGPTWTGSWGVAGVPVTSANMSAAPVAVTDPPTSLQHLVIDDLLISSDTALRFTLTEQTSGTVIAYLRLPANGSLHVALDHDLRKLPTADRKLMCQTSAAGNVEILAGYHSEA